MVIQHNMQAMNTNRQLGISVGAAAKSTEKLSSGYRINRAGDDAAGLAISEKMRSQIRGLDRASANSQDGISLIQTAEGALNETQSILQRMRELSVQAANGTNTDSDRNEIQKEVNQLTSEINRIANTTEFNTMKLLKGNTNKAEIGGVGTETLKDGETGIVGGALENFKVDQTSTVAKESTANMTANSSKATGSMTSEVLDTKTAGKQGEYSSATVAGITFSSKTKEDTLNGKEIKIVTIADMDTTNNMKNKEGIVLDGNTLYIALREETVNKLDTAQELMDKIADFTNGSAVVTVPASGSTVAALNNATGLTLGAAASAQSIDTAFGAANGLEMKLPVDEATGNPVNASLPLSAGNLKTGKMSAGAGELQGEFKLEIDKIFKEEDDVITIGKEKFVAKAEGADNPSAGEFGLGSSHAMHTFKLEGKATGGGNFQLVIDGKTVTAGYATGDSAKSVLNQLKNSAESQGLSVLYNEDAGSIAIVSKSVGTGATVGTAAASVDGFVVKDAAQFDGVDVTAASKDADIKKAQQNNLAAAIALNANLSKDYYVSNKPAADGHIVIKEREGSGGAGKDLDKSITVSGGGKDDSITITNPLGMNGIQFVLVNEKDPTNVAPKGTKDGTTGYAANDLDTDVLIGQDAADKNKFYINLGKTTNGNTAAKIQQALRNYAKAGNIKLADGTAADFSDLKVEANGDWDNNVTNASNVNKGESSTAGGVQEKQGTYSFDVDSLFKEGDQVTVLGKTFAGKTKGADLNKGEFDISSTNRTVQALRLKEALAANLDIASKYDVDVNNTKIILKEKEASGTDMKESDVGVQNLGTQGQYKVDDMGVLADGASVTIDGQKIDVSSKNAHVGYADGTAIKVADSEKDQKAALVDAINKNAELNKKYEASIGDDGSLMLTQKVGSDNAPEITTTSSTKGTFDVTFQVGANTGQSMTIAIGDNRANALGVSGDGTEESIMADNGATAYYTKTENVTDGTTNDNIEFALDVTSFEKATAAIGVIDDALTSISAQRSQLGAYQNRLEHTIANLDNTSENLQSSESRIRDVDMAKEMTNFSKNNILQQAAQSMLAQANQSTQGVLTLLR